VVYFLYAILNTIKVILNNTIYSVKKKIILQNKKTKKIKDRYNVKKRTTSLSSGLNYNKTIVNCQSNQYYLKNYHLNFDFGDK